MPNVHLHYRRALRQCIADPNLSTVLNLAASSPPGAAFSKVVLFRTAERSDLDDRVVQAALSNLVQLHGPKPLLQLRAVRNPSASSTRRLQKLLAGIDGGVEAMLAIVGSTNSSFDTKQSALIGLVELGGARSLRRAVRPLARGTFNSASNLFSNLLENAETLFRDPAPVIAELLDILSSPDSEFFRDDAPDGKRRKTKSARRKAGHLSRFRKHWERMVHSDRHLRSMVRHIKRLAELEEWSTLEHLVKCQSSRVTGLAAAELLNIHRPDITATLFLSAFRSTEREWVAERYVELLGDRVGIAEFADTMYGGATHAAKAVAAARLARLGGRLLNREAIDALQFVARSSSAVSVRRAALWALSSFNSPDVIEFLLRMIADETQDKKVHFSAREALERIAPNLFAATFADVTTRRAAQVIAATACNVPHRRREAVGDLSHAASTLRIAMAEDAGCNQMLDEALTRLDEASARRSAIRRISLAAHISIKEFSSDARREIAIEIDRELEVLQRNTDDPGWRRLKREAAKCVHRAVLDAVCRFSGVNTGQAPLLSKVLSRALTAKRRPRGAMRVERVRQQTQSWCRTFALAVSA